VRLEETVVNILRVLSLVVVGTLLACSSPEAEWKKADALGTVAAYQKFVTDHPTDSHAAQASGRILALQDDAAWADAQKTNTSDSYKQYVQTQPNGAHVADARDRMTGFERADAWKAAQVGATAATLQAFLQKYPQGTEADQARAQLQKLSAEQYRVQLAAFRAKGEAEHLRTRLQARYGSVLHEVVVVPATASDKLNRVSSKPMSQEDAQSACATLKKAKQHCEVVKG
jgi:hypothetical protein